MAVATKKKPAANTKPERDRGMSYKDVQILFLSDGLSKVEKLLNAGLISKGSLRRAAKEFEGNKNAQAFVDFVAAKTGNGRRGRRAPLNNENREYLAQQVKDGSLFIRLPVSSIVAKKGEAVVATFSGDRIVVKTA